MSLKCKILSAIFVVVLCLITFYLGRFSVSRSIVTYSVDGQHQVAVHLDWPAYGLPLIEYEIALSDFRADRSTRALERLEVFLDFALYDAERRRPVLPADKRVDLDKCLSKVASYRAQFPRPLSQGTGFYWTSERQSKVDDFLRAFLPSDHQPAQPIE